MNHNFADWELTQLLPEKNHHNMNMVWFYLVPHKLSPKKIGGDTMLPEPFFEVSHNSQKYSEFNYESSEIIRDAWTFDDIRLYLLSKNYKVQEISPQFGYSVFTTSQLRDDNRWVHIHSKRCDTYEEARRESIIYCLKLINQTMT